MLKTETVAFAIAFLSFCFSIIAAVWKVSTSLSTMKTDLKELVINVRHDLDLKSAKLDHLDDTVILGINGLREKFEHFSTRSRTEVNELNRRLQDVEEFLAKKTEFERHK
jgi:uncharacterized protein YoxC